MKTYPLYLNGEFVTSETAWDVLNPATGETFAKISTIDRRRLAQALADAHAAFAGWRQITAKARGEYLRRIASELERLRDEIARLISSENGKPLAQSLGEIGMTVDHLQWFAEEGRRAYGRMIPPQIAGKRNMVIKTPLGVVGAISPWNFPLVLAVRKVAPALAAGCPVVLKPARQTPLSCIAFAECAHAAQLPKGVLQVVCGQSNEIGQEFLSNPLCRKVTFTGSTEVGRALIRGAADTIKPLSLELGGNAPLLVFDDTDLKVAVEGALLAKMRNTGQSCIASNRLLVQRSIYPRFLDFFVAGVKALKVGEFSELGVEIGPMIDQAASLGAYIEFVYNGLTGASKAFTFADYAKAIRAVGPEHCILSSDMGQPATPLHPDGLVAFFTGLEAEGIAPAEIGEEDDQAVGMERVG